GRRVDDGPDAGSDRATEQARVLHRQLARHRNCRACVHDRPRRIAPAEERLRDHGAVALPPESPPRAQGRPAPARVPATAGSTPAAGRPPREHDPLADARMLDALADLLDDASTLVPE